MPEPAEKTITIKAAKDAIAAEPELPGEDIPEELRLVFEALRNAPYEDALKEFLGTLRFTVRETKLGILERLEQLEGG